MFQSTLRIVAASWAPANVDLKLAALLVGTFSVPILNSNILNKEHMLITYGHRLSDHRGSRPLSYT